VGQLFTNHTQLLALQTFGDLGPADVPERHTPVDWHQPQPLSAVHWLQLVYPAQPSGEGVTGAELAHVAAFHVQPEEQEPGDPGPLEVPDMHLDEAEHHPQGLTLQHDEHDVSEEQLGGGGAAVTGSAVDGTGVGTRPLQYE
jgi:hypothetical protein